MQSALSDGPFDSLDLSVLTAALEWSLACNRFCRGELGVAELREARVTYDLAKRVYREHGWTVAGLFDRLDVALTAVVP